MAYITNGGARLIERARLEGKSLVFGSVRMNTIFEPTPDELVYRSDEWFGANVGEVVGCLSHVSVDDVSCVCDSKLAVQCNDNSEAWKSMGIYAHLEGEVDDLLFACESIQNGEYKDVTVIELPVTLDGAVADFGLSEGGGSGGGGSEDGSTAPLTGEWQSYSGEGSVEDPVDGGIRTLENLSVGGGEASIVLERQESQYNGEEGIWGEDANTFLRITPSGVSLNESGANWSDIINAANGGGGGEGGSTVPLIGSWHTYEGTGSEENPEDGDRQIFENISVGAEGASISFQTEDEQYTDKDGWYSADSRQLLITSYGVTFNETAVNWSAIIKAASNESKFSTASISMEEGIAYLNGIEQLKPNQRYKIDAYVNLVIDGEGQISAVRATSGEIMDISAAVYESASGTMHRVSGISANESDLSFESPITPAEGQEIYVHWTRMA